MRQIRPAQAFFAVTIAALGVVGFLLGDFTPVWDGIPDGMLGREFLVYFTAALSIATGAGLLSGRTALRASLTLLLAFLVWLVVVRLPTAFLAPGEIGNWWGCGDTALMTAAAWYCYHTATRDRGASFLSGTRGAVMARVLSGLAFIPFGIAHFTFLDRTVPLVPHWLPWPTAVAYGTGIAFIAAGVAILIGVLPRLAATLVTLQIAGFTIIVWIPILLRQPGPHDWLEFYNSWALLAASWVVAESYRGAAWLPRRAR